jgi:hypothetical protein
VTSPAQASPPRLGGQGPPNVPQSAPWTRLWTRLERYLKKHNRQIWFLAVSFAGFAAFLVTGVRYGWWQAGVTALSISIAVTIIPIVVSFLGLSELNSPSEWFDNATHLVRQPPLAV